MRESGSKLDQGLLIGVVQGVLGIILFGLLILFWVSLWISTFP